MINFLMYTERRQCSYNKGRQHAKPKPKHGVIVRYDLAPLITKETAGTEVHLYITT
jgi:hypothetical protein